MTLSEASKKYGFPLDRLCRAVSAAGVEPVGERQGIKKRLKEYDEKALLDVITGVYKQKFIRAKRETERWKLKANYAIALYVKDHPRPVHDDND